MHELHKRGRKDLIKQHEKTVFAVYFFLVKGFSQRKDSKKLGKKTAKTDTNCLKNMYNRS